MSSGTAVAAHRGSQTGLVPVGKQDHGVSHHAITNVPTALSDEPAAAVRERLLHQSYDDASHIFVQARDGRLEGFVPIAELLAASGGVTIGSMALRNSCPVVSENADPEDAANIAIRAGSATIAVVHADGRFAGAIPSDALMRILREEHVEDLHLMAGIWSRSAAARAALLASPFRRALYRLPWLLVGAAGSALATLMMVRFESTLTANIALAFFVPAIVYMADAVGTQAEAVAVRGISLVQNVTASALWGELGTGVLIGATFGLIGFPTVWLAFGSVGLALTVSLSLVAACSVATLVGVALPLIFARLGYDPAYGSGPIATVIQDVLSLLIYFGIATSVLL